MEITRNHLMKIEAFFRLFAMLTLLLAAIVLGTDKQSRIYFGAYKKNVNYKVAYIFKLCMKVYVIGAGYSLLQLIRCLVFTKYEGDKLSRSIHILKWIYFLLDQMAAYVVFAIVCASLQLSILAITGVSGFEWMKLCSKYVRFCVQIGGCIACGITASLILAVISAISTFNLFRWYSPNFLCLKPKKIGIVATSN